MTESYRAFDMVASCKFFLGHHICIGVYFSYLIQNAYNPYISVGFEKEREKRMAEAWKFPGFGFSFA